MYIYGSTITVIGSFQPVAITRDIRERGGTAVPEINDSTNYVLVGQNLSGDDMAILDEAARMGIPCVNLIYYKEQMPSDLEEE